MLGMGLLCAPLFLRSANILVAEAETITITAVGDIMLGARATSVIRKYGVDYPFVPTRGLLTESDLTFGNFEAPFGKTGIAAEKQYTFLVRPEFAKGLERAGFDVLSLANNHTLDYGQAVLLETIAVLKQHNMKGVGAGRNITAARAPALFTVRGVNVAFLAYSMTYPKEFYAARLRPGTAQATLLRVREDVRKARLTNDIVAVSFHWGAERMVYPKEYQKEFARAAIDAGASLILGHHPHVLQGVERYKDGVIAYSLGNFSFGTYNDVQDSMILTVSMNKQGVVENATITPLSVFNKEVHFQPALVEGVEAERVIRYLHSISTHLNTSVVSRGGKGLVEKSSQ